MKTVFEVTNPDEMKFTLKITMPLRDWKRLKDSLTSDYPTWKISEVIRKMVQQAQIQMEQVEQDLEMDK